MTVTLDLTFPDALPVWAWVALGAAAWYAVAACVVRWTPYGTVADNGGPPRFLLWLFSPIGLPVLAVIGVLFAFEDYVLTPRKA